VFPYCTLIYYQRPGDTDLYTVEVRGGWKGVMKARKPRKPKVVIT
jgi:hypothetical protein